MKILCFLMLELFVQVEIGHTQDIDVTITNSGWYPIGGDGQTVTNDGAGSETVFVPANIQTPPTPPIIAEAITPALQALADGLQGDPVRIFNYVHDHIRYVLYFGSKKGAQLTLLEKSGNDFDQCALLVALLRAAGYTNAAYQFGWMLVPYDNPDGSHRDMHHWLGLNLTNNNWTVTGAYLDKLFKFWRSYPMVRYNFDHNTFAFQRVWVTLPVGGTTYYLDPSFKVSEPVAGIDLSSAMGFSSNGLMSVAGGLATNNYVTNLNEAALRGALTGYTTNLLGFLQSNYPNASVEQILGGQSIVPSTNKTLSQSLLFPTVNLDGTMPVVSWINQPTNLMSTLAVSFLSTNYQWFMPQLQGQRLSLTASAAGLAQLWQDDTLVAQGNTGGGSGTFNVTLSIYHPRGDWDAANNRFIPGTIGQTSGKPYQKINATYALLYAFEPDWGWLQERQRQLQAYQQQGLSDSSRQVVSETLNVMGLNWQLQVESLSRILAAQIGALPMFYHRIGRMSQEQSFGYYVDIYLAMEGSISSYGPACDYACDRQHQQMLEMIAYFASAMEHGLIEQQQEASLLGASTVKILQLANTNHGAIYLATSANWTNVQGKLLNYSAGSLSSLGSRVNAGYTLLLPRNGITQIGGAGSWSGYGLLGLNPAGGAQMLIGDTTGIHYGGYV